MWSRILLPLALLLVAAAPSDTDEAAAIRGDVAYLASDRLAGRDVGSPGFEQAADYVAKRFAEAGLKPAGTNGAYRQPVSLVRYMLDGARVSIDGVLMQEGADYRANANPAARQTRVHARVVFVGNGVDAPTLRRNDYAGIDVRGAIVAFVTGAPAGMKGDEALYLASDAAKLRAAARHGAVGVVMLTDAAGPVRGRTRSWAWAEADGTAHTDGVPLLATFTAAGSARLFAGAARSWETTRALTGKQAFAPEPLAVTLSVESATTFTPVASSNLVGVIPGSDPVLRNEAVVLSAHLDHIGVSEKPDARGDRINNGALDDAIGISMLLAEARRFQAAAPPRRTIVFLAVTGEEKGLLGSDWFLHHRPAGLENIVADVNLDMPILTYRFTDLVAFGGERSTLGTVIARAARASGARVTRDPIPEQGIFVRSDHFRFVAQGVPAVFLWPGLAGEGRAAYEDFMRNRYHRAGDEVDQGIRWDQAARFAALNYRIAREIADAPERPTWRKGEFFAREFSPAAQ